MSQPLGRWNSFWMPGIGDRTLPARPIQNIGDYPVACYTPMVGLLRSTLHLVQLHEMGGIERAVCRGDIDFIADDHAPHEVWKKSWTIHNLQSGLPGVQTTILLTYELLQRGQNRRATFC